MILVPLYGSETLAVDMDSGQLYERLPDGFEPKGGSYVTHVLGVRGEAKWVPVSNPLEGAVATSPLLAVR